MRDVIKQVSIIDRAIGRNELPWPGLPSLVVLREKTYNSVLLVVLVFMLVVEASFPKLLVLEAKRSREPTSALDRNSRLRLREEVGKNSDPPILVGANEVCHKVS